MLLEQLLQGNGMGENCEEQEDVEEKYESDGSLQRKAKAVADCMVQAQEGEMGENGREGHILTIEKSVSEVGRPYFVVSKREEESGGVDEEFIQVTKKDMDALLREAKQASEMTVNSTKLLLETTRETGIEKNVGINPGEVVEDDAMDWEWEKKEEPSVDEQMRNLREEMAEMSLRVERLERNMPLGCEESESSSGGGEWAWWSGAWWIKTKTEMNSASRRKVHRAISQSLGRSSEKNKLSEEKTSGTGNDEAKSWRKFGKPEQMMFDSKKSRRARNEQANSANGAANSRNASMAEGTCVNTPGSSSGTQILNKVARSWPGT